MLSIQRVSKRFGSVQALDGVSADFLPGEIHAILGENGAGKSTLMGVLGGFVMPDSGTVTKDGRTYPTGRPAEARRAGVAMVHQHFTLVPAFTVAENLCLAQARSLWGAHDRVSDARAPLELAAQIGWHLDPTAVVRDLPVGSQQRVETLKALGSDCDVLIFDEPTAVLAPDEVDDLFQVLRRLAAQGKTILLIAHKLSEVLAIADRITILRRGKWVASALRSEVDANTLAEWMTGEKVQASASRREGNAGATPKCSVRDLHVKGDRGEPSVRGVSFDIAPGQVFGIGGIDGNGQVELAEALAGVRAADSGSVELVGANVAYIPQDRQTDGLALNLSIQDNLLIGGLDRADLRRGFFLRTRVIEKWIHEIVNKFEIKVGRVADPVSSLSGGNQQKVVVARSLATLPDLIVAVNPTRGLDIKATRFVHDQLREAARQGAAVALISTDQDELDALADRSIYLSRGELVTAIGGDA